MNGHHEVCALLLTSPATNINQQDASGVTPLHYAVTKKHKMVVTVLLQGGANVEIQDNVGRTAVDVASDESVVTLLLQAGKSIH